MTQKIKVLYTSEFGNLTSGGQRSLMLLLDFLDQDKYQPVLVSREEGELLQEAKLRRIPVKVMAPQGLRSLNVFRIRRSFKELTQFVKNMDIGLIHTESPRWTFYLGPIAKALKIPLIYHVRVSTPEPWLYERMTYSRSTKISAVSEFAAKRFKSFSGFSKKVSVIYNAVDIEKFHPKCDGSRLRGELGLDRDILIGIVGQLTTNKGQKEFLQAAAKVVQDMPNTKFIIIGKEVDGYRSELNRLISDLSLDPFVAYYTSRPDMPATMAAIDILVNASHMEGFSRVIVEGMASGKPIIATEVGGNPEAVLNNETGLLVAPKDPDQLAQAILALGKDEQLRRKMGTEGRKRAEQFFSIDAQIREIEALYRQLVG